ncbi:MAG: hypothetical protein AAGK37_19375 [Pseudomonadota bacterium]
MTVLSIDFETASQVDLRRTGAFKYSLDPSTRVLCLAYAFDDEAPSIWRYPDPIPALLADHVARRRTVQAWNAGFEIVIWNNVLKRQFAAPDLDHRQVKDTMARAAYWGLPLSLDQASEAANTGHLKDKEGHALMLRMSKPRAVEDDGTVRWWHEEDPEKYQRLCDYCVQDVITERAIADTLPQLPDVEQRTWELDFRINQRGVGVDLDRIRNLERIWKDTQKVLNKKMSDLTGGVVKTVTATAAMFPVLRQHGYPHPDITRPNVLARLKDPACRGTERQMLELRAAGARTSAAKLKAMVDAACADGRIRGMLQYYGAFRTGRWAGRLVQPQNLPRPELDIDGIEAFCAAVEHGLSYDQLGVVYDPAAAVASCLRSCLAAAA